MKKRIVVIGGGGHAKVLIGILKKFTHFSIVGFTDNNYKEAILGVEYLGNDSVLQKIKMNYPDCFAAMGIGYLEVTDKRKTIYDLLKSDGYYLPHIISPDATVNEQVEFKEGTVVFDGVVVNSGAKIGACAIINSNSTIEHDCEIGDFVHIAPGVTLSGGVKIGSYSIVGAGAIVIQNKTIGERCLIGAGTTVLSDCLKPGTYVGVPARKIK